MQTLIVNAAEGTSETRDLTNEEIAQAEADAAEAQAAEQAAAQAVADREAAKASALAKLEALGLTTEEAQAIAGI